MKATIAALVGGAGVLAAVHAAPALTSVAPLRRRVWPVLSGIGDPGHIALTFDDGPDPLYTPRLLRILDALDVRATFFLLGRMLSRQPGLGRELVAAGHELALHGWDHHLLLRRGPGTTAEDLRRGRELIEDIGGSPVRWWRPPYGVLTAGGVAAARQLGLTPVLWTTWGRDWTAASTAESVLATVNRNLRPGGTILLHDSDCASVPGSSTATLRALPALIGQCRTRGLRVGPLREHRHPGQALVSRGRSATTCRPG